MLDPSVYSDTAVPWLPDSRLRDRYLTWVPRPCVPKETGSQLADVTPTQPEVAETGFWSARVDRRFPNCTIPYVKYIVTMHTVCQHCVSSHSAYNMRAINEYLDTQEKKMAAQLKAYDLVHMFVHYYVTPNGKSWKVLSNELADKRADLKDKLITQDAFQAWLNQQPESTLLVPLQDMMKARQRVAHTDLRAKVDQEDFLIEVESFPWSEFLPPDHQRLVHHLIIQLKKAPLKRAVAKLYNEDFSSLGG